MSNACCGIARLFALPTGPLTQSFSARIGLQHASAAFPRESRHAWPLLQFYSVAPLQSSISSISRTEFASSRFTYPSRPHRIRTFHTAPISLARTTGPKTPHGKEKHEKKEIEEGRRVSMPFGTVHAKQLAVAFGQDVPVDRGNQILRALHERRVMGSLVDKGVEMSNAADISYDARVKALNWLRERHPVDEQKAAEVWVGKQSRRVEGKKESAEVEPETSSAQTQDSVLQQWLDNRKEQKRLKAEEDERKEAERQKDPEVQQEKQLAIAKREDRVKRVEEYRKERAQRMAKWEEQSYTEVNPNKPPPLSWLVMPTVFGLAVLLFAFVSAAFYTPPANSSRLLKDVPTSVATIGTICAINFVVYSLWHWPPAWRYLNRFALQFPSWPGVPNVLLNIFSHQRFRHLAPNMAGLALFGVAVHEDIGRGNFLAVYVAGGVTGSLASLWFHVATDRLAFYSNGASGAVWAIMAAWGYLTFQKPAKPTESWGFYADATLYGVLLVQVLSTFAPRAMQTYDIVSHIAGAFLGLICAVSMHAEAERRKIEDQKTDEQKMKEAQEHHRKYWEQKSQAAREHREQMVKEQYGDPKSHKPNFVKVDRE